MVHNADGQLVARQANAITIAVYVAGGLYEQDPSTGQYQKYYRLGGRLVAEREVPTGGTSSTAGTLHYLHQEHLGSTTLQSTSSGTYEGHQFRGPFGQPWASDGTLATDLQYTGQRSFEGGAAPMGSLLDYGSRAYSPILGRFLSPDTIVPSWKRPQDLNRYAYVTNNPIRYADPTGHRRADEDSAGYTEPPTPAVPAEIPQSDGNSWRPPSTVSPQNAALGNDPSPSSVLYSVVNEQTWDSSGDSGKPDDTRGIDDPTTQRDENNPNANGSGSGAGRPPKFPGEPQFSTTGNAQNPTIIPVTQIQNYQIRPTWTGTNKLTPTQNAEAHWQKHGSQFPEFKSSTEYINGTHGFLNSPPSTALTKVRANGDTVVYDPVGNVFAISAPSGAPRTMYKPDPAIHPYATNMDYYNAQ